MVTMLLGALACATTGPLEVPDVTLTDVELVEATLFESTMDISVRVTNTNPDPLVVDGVAFRLELDGRSFGKATSGERVEIPRFDSVVVQLELTVSHVAIATKLRHVLESKVVDYAIVGKLYVVSPSGGTITLPIDKAGTIDLSGGGPGSGSSDL